MALRDPFEIPPDMTLGDVWTQGLSKILLGLQGIVQGAAVERLDTGCCMNSESKILLAWRWCSRGRLGEA